MGNCGEFEDGEFYDVVAQNCDIRFDLNANTPPSTRGERSCTATSSSAIGLDWLDNSSDEQSFEIERSPDGSTFGFLDSVTANTTSYADSGLAADTTYFYQVRAVNGFGASGYSNAANATTDPAAQATAVQVGSITVSTVNIGQGNKIGRAEVVVDDDQGGLVSGAIVTGEFTGTFNEAIPASDPTNASGVTVIDTSGSAKGNVSVTFCVTGITHPTLEDFSAAPGEVCGSA